MWNLLPAIIIMVITLIWYFRRKPSYWQKNNVPHEKPQFIVENLGDVIFGHKSLADVYNTIYNKHSDVKYCGIMNFGSPAILLRDPELIKAIISKEHDKYHSCRNENNELAKDRRWKRAKAKITPQLTPLKVKNMFHLLQEITDKLVRCLKSDPEVGNRGLDVKELSAKYASDVIGSCVFGLETDSFNNIKPEIRQLGIDIFAYNSFFIVLNVIALLFHRLYKIKPPKILSERLTANFEQLIIATIKSREEKKVKKHDFLGAMVELKSLTKGFDFSLEKLIFRSLGFFLDGFEMSVVTLQHVLRELAKNSVVQEKLFQQLQMMLLRNVKLSYDSLKEVKYLDMIIYETLRKCPPIPFLAKECEGLVLPPAKSGYPELKVEKGTNILIPILSLHNDSVFFEEPGEFAPERFHEDLNYRNVKDGFVGFADGPRLCLGRRFALTQLKLAIFAIVTNFEVKMGEEICKNVLLDPIRFVYETKTDYRLKFVTRVENKVCGNYSLCLITPY